MQQQTIHLLHKNNMDFISKQFKASTQGIAHDLRNLLGAIYGYLELLEDDVPQNSNAYSYLKNAKLSTELALDLNRRFISPDTNAPQFINPGMVIQKVAKSILGITGIKWTYSEQEAIPNFYMDKILFERLLENIFSNAVKALKGNGLVEIFSRKTDNIFQNGHIPDKIQYLHISIADNGPGIPLSVLQKLETDCYLPKTDGHGMGLIIVKEIIKKVNGHFKIIRNDDRGTVFNIYLPLKEI